MRSRKWLSAAAALAATLSGCAAGPYYDDPYYGSRDYAYNYPRPGPYGPTYYGPAYYAPGYYVAPPAVSFGFSYSDHGHHH